jgi:hypothetical protein
MDFSGYDRKFRIMLAQALFSDKAHAGHKQQRRKSLVRQQG